MECFVPSQHNWRCEPFITSGTMTATCANWLEAILNPDMPLLIGSCLSRPMNNFFSIWQMSAVGWKIFSSPEVLGSKARAQRE